LYKKVLFLLKEFHIVVIMKTNLFKSLLVSVLLVGAGTLAFCEEADESDISDKEKPRVKKQDKEFKQDREIEKPKKGGLKKQEKWDIEKPEKAKEKKKEGKDEELNSEKPSKEKKEILESLNSGEINLIIGTHALLQSNVVFKNLGYIIIDEQHRFGVEQRAKLRLKGENTDLLIMTATPIPRSLSMTLYGDMDVTIIKEKPGNRQEITTLAFPDSRLPAVYNSLRKYIDQGRQIYYILPLIEESEKIDLKSAIETFYHLSSKVFPDKRVAILHGKMSQKEKDEIMEAFREGFIDLLVSTTVVEVGVDVANANVMVIEHAERFGLAQLHQLRGRVGRGEHKSFCVLIHKENLSEDAAQRIKIMTETSDGFIISEKDLLLRGSGELIGTRQHGFFEFEFTDPSKDINLIIAARDEARLFVQTLDITDEFSFKDFFASNKIIKNLRAKRLFQILA